MQLAVKNYEFRQAIYKSELEELKRYYTILSDASWIYTHVFVDVAWKISMY